MTRWQEPPNSVQIEPTEGCNLRCTFCGIRGIREGGRRGELSGPFRFMSVDTAATIVTRLREAGWDRQRIEFAMHGEPTLNRALPAIVHLFRVGIPRAQLMVTSNGVPIADQFDDKLAELYAAGLNVFALDDYAPHKVAPLARRFPAAHHHVTRYEYPADRDGSPHLLRRPNSRALTIVADIGEATAGTHSHLSNHAGCASPRDRSTVGRICARPFREISVRYDGAVAICCDDWRGEYPIGNVIDSTLDEIWQHPRFEAARRKLYLGQRDFGPCDGCTARSYRVGLLPDRMGRETMPAPDADGDTTIAGALASGPLTAPVYREWENITLGPPR